MARILIIDDDVVIRKMVSNILAKAGYEISTAPDGIQGLKAVKTEQPNAIIADVKMPDIDGYEVTRRLRRDSRFARIPILILTGQSNLQEKLLAFESGADDHMSKPFEPTELVARLAKLLHWSEALREAQKDLASTEQAQLIAVHSLRGGVGCSSLAVNLALGLNGLWKSPTMLLDLTLSAGQVALMLDTSLKRTWADLVRFGTQDMDIDLLNTVISQHESGLDFVAAPAYPEDAETLTSEMLTAALGVLRTHYGYIVADLSHDFNDITLPILDAAHRIILMLAPDMASVRAAAIALDTYQKLGYESDKIKLVLNWTFRRNGLARKSIEQALHAPISLVVPFAPSHFVLGINMGKPFLLTKPEDPISALLEDFAFRLSKEEHRLIPPAVPSPAWVRVNERLSARDARSGKES